jgi:iron complex outermembrane receptor protein
MRNKAIVRAVRRGRSLSIGSLVVFLCAWAEVGTAVEPPDATRHVVEQPSQAMAETLRSIARQTGASVLFDPGVVNGRVSRPVSGRLTAAEAILRALDGSGLTASVMSDGAIVVRPATAAAPGSQQAPIGPRPTSLKPGSGGAADDVPLRVAQVSAPGEPHGAGGASADGGQAAEKLERVEVTGSRLKRIATEGPVPVNTYSRADIERSGQPTLERFLATLNEVSVSAGEGAVGSTLGQGTVQLRGLPLGATLVLVNGRRVQAVGSSSANFFNLNLIPIAAIERVEIVPVGSSAVYGGDALAGVVNVILKKSLDGQTLSMRLGSGHGIGDHSVSLATGAGDQQGSYLLMGTYGKTTPLTMAEREFFLDADYRRYGGPDARVRNCTPGTVSSSTGNNLPGLGAGFAGIPSLAAGAVPAVSDFAPTAGQANLCNVWANGNGYALVHGIETIGVHALGDRQIAAGWSVFGELTLARERLHADEIGLSLNNVLVPANNPYNPFGEAVRVTALLGGDNGTQGLRRQTRFTRALLGLRGEVATNWDAELTASTTQDHGESRMLNGNVNAVARNAALGASTVGLALNPFTVGRAASEEVLRGIWSDTVRMGNGRKDQVSGFLRGNVLTLPAGPMEAIVGAEVSRDVYETSIPGQVSVLNNRRARAAYGELRVPLWQADEPSGRAWNLAALTFAARRDHYSDFGSANTFQAGVEVRPSRSLLLRASTATSFKPPTMLQTNVEEAAYPAELFGLVDPARGNEPVTSGELVRGTNTNLGPERGRAYALGAVWEPESAAGTGSGTRLGVTAWRVRIDSLISIPPPQDLLNHEDLFPGFVSRGPSVDGMPGPLTRLLLAEANFGGVETAGVDLEAGYGWRGPLGRWTLGAGATRASEHRVAVAPGAPAVDRLGRRFSDYWSPEWKGRLSAGFNHEAWSMGITSRYISSYLDRGSSQRRLGDSWVHDLAGSLDLMKLGIGSGDWAKTVALTVAIANATNRQPQFVENAPYYDVTQADWRGRYSSVQLTVDW